MATAEFSKFALFFIRYNNGIVIISLSPYLLAISTEVLQDLSVLLGVIIIDMPEPAKSPPAPKKGSKKAVTKAQKKDGKKRKRSRKENYSV